MSPPISLLHSPSLSLSLSLLHTPPPHLSSLSVPLSFTLLPLHLPLPSLFLQFPHSIPPSLSSSLAPSLSLTHFTVYRYARLSCMFEAESLRSNWLLQVLTHQDTGCRMLLLCVFFLCVYVCMCVRVFVCACVRERVCVSPVMTTDI